MKYWEKFTEYFLKFMITIKMLTLLVIIPFHFVYFISTKDRLVLGILFDRMGSDFKKLGSVKIEE